MPWRANKHSLSQDISLNHIWALPGMSYPPHPVYYVQYTGCLRDWSQSMSRIAEYTQNPGPCLIAIAVCSIFSLGQQPDTRQIAVLFDMVDSGLLIGSFIFSWFTTWHYLGLGLLIKYVLGVVNLLESGVLGGGARCLGISRRVRQTDRTPQHQVITRTKI